MSKRMPFVCLVTIVLTATAAVGQLAAPANLSAKVTADGGITASATPVVGATSYTMTVKDRSGNVLATQTTTTPSITTAALPANIIADIRATAHSSTATSPEAAASVVMPPPPPTGIKGLGGPLRVTVSWVAVPGATSYQLTLSNGMSFVTSSTSYIVTGLQTATSYNAIVASINSGGRGMFSPVVAVRTANIAY